jgi:hypothetical protein
VAARCGAWRGLGLNLCIHSEPTCGNFTSRSTHTSRVVVD